jgi:hypothetical protein
MEEIGPDSQKLKLANLRENFKDDEETADKLIEVRTVPEKGKLLERAGRKITGLKPEGQGSGIAEEDHPLVNSVNHYRKARSIPSGLREARERPTSGQGGKAFPNHKAKGVEE